MKAKTQSVNALLVGKELRWIFPAKHSWNAKYFNYSVFVVLIHQHAYKRIQYTQFQANENIFSVSHLKFPYDLTIFIMSLIT